MTHVEKLSQLLTRDPNRRLGSGKEDAEEIKRQPFFKDVSWDDVLNKRIPPPYFPTIVRVVIHSVLQYLVLTVPTEW
jgi:serine/threonine protein kinase